MFKTDLPEIYDMFEPNILISSDYQDSGFPYETKQLNNFKAMLKGVPPPSSITISKITVEDILDYYKDNEKSFGLGLTSEKRNFNYSEENSIPFLNFLNSSCNTETIASLMQKVQERYIQLETLSSCNIWFKSILQSIGSTNKQHRVRQNIGSSPGRRLSHLARRRQYFSCANLQQIANFEKTRQIEIKKNKYEGNYKKITQTITFEKLNSSKRALFLSPEDGTPKKYEKFRSGERKPFSFKFDENKRLPLQENSKKLEVSKWLSEQNFNIDFPRKRLRDECLNHTHETKRKCPRRSLNFEDEEVSFSSNNMPLDNNSFSDKKTPIVINKLSQNHKNKLLWAVSIVLKENNIPRSDEIFKICASTLFHKCRKNLDKIFSLQTANGTSEKMLQYARSQISSVFQELNINFRTANNVSEESKKYVQNNINLMSKLVKFSSTEESKENVLENKVDKSRPCLLDAELQLLFKTPRKMSRKRTIKSCQKGAAKDNERADNLKRCRSLESLIKTNVEMSFSVILKDLKECKFTFKEEVKYNGEEKLINTSNSEDQSFEANIFMCAPKDSSVNISESVPSGTRQTENNEISNNSSSFVFDLADKDFSLAFSPIPSSVKNFDSPASLFPALCLNRYNSEDSFDCNNYTPNNTEYSPEISDQDKEMKSHFVLFTSNSNVDHENQYLKFESSGNSFNEENGSEIMEKSDLKIYRCLENDVCDISAKSSNKEIIACNQKTTIDNFNYELSHTDSYINKALTDSVEIFDKLTIHQFPHLSDSVAVTDLNNSDQVANKIREMDTGNEYDLTLSSNSTGDLEKILSSSPAEKSFIEKGIYKPRKLVVKKSKPNWKVVRQNSEEFENNSDLKLKMRLSHEWEVIHRTSYSSDVTNNSENEGNSFSSSQVSSINDDKNYDEVQVGSDRDNSTLSFHEDIGMTHALNCSEDKLIQNSEDHSVLKVQSDKVSESKISDKCNENISLPDVDVNISDSSFVSHSFTNESSFLKEDCACLKNEVVNGELQKSNPLAMNSFKECIVNLKDNTLTESKEHNGTTTYSDILNEKHDSVFANCENEFISQNESEFKTDQTENLSTLNVFKENLSSSDIKDINNHLCNEKNKNIFEIKNSLLLFEKKVDENINTVVVDRLLDKEIFYERANVVKKEGIYDYCLEKTYNCKDNQISNTQENKFKVCLESPTIFNPSNDCLSFVEFETISQYNEKKSPSRYKKTDTSWEKDNISPKQLGNCVPIQAHTDKSINSSVLINSKPTKRFLVLEGHKTQKLKVIKNLERKISQPEKVQKAEVVSPKEDNCNLKNPKEKSYDIELKHPINEYKCKSIYKDKFRKELKNEHYQKDKTNVLDNLNYSDLTQESQINNINSIFNDSKANYDDNTNDKDKDFFKNEELLKAPISESYVPDNNESNLALQPINLNCNKLFNLDDGERKTENSVQNIVSALSALSTLVEEQIKLENEKVKTKQLNKDNQESISELENLKNNWSDVISYWCDKNLNNLKFQSGLFSDSYKFEDNMKVVKHILDTEKSQDCEIEINNLKKNILSKDFVKKQTVVKYQQQQNYSWSRQPTDLESKNEGEVLKTTNSKRGFEENSSAVFEKMSNLPNFLNEKIDMNDNARFYMYNGSHSLNRTKNSYNYNAAPVNPKSDASNAFNVQKFQIENNSKKRLNRNEKYDALKYRSTYTQHYLKPVDVDCKVMNVGSECKIASQNYFLETNEQNQLFLNNEKHPSMQSNQNNACHGSVLTSNTRMLQSEYDRHSSNVSSSYFQYSSIQTPMSNERKHSEFVNNSAMSIYNSHYLMKNSWPQSNLQDQSGFSQNQQFFENFTGKFPSTSNNFKASSDYRSQNNCASDVQIQFKSPNIYSQKQSSMFCQFNNVCNVYSSWQFPPDLNSCNYKQNVLNDGFQNSSAFSYPVPNIPYYINYFR